ncbi:MAG TPA: DHA2 family efflux MFS transporter permease subunit [Solirubrobacterales bacterium]|nr:DHA2 family efflux MFS transporter permease subunit [Solirubrobacterales bacterium]
MEGNSSGGVAFASGAGRWLLVVTVAGSGMAFLDSTVVNVALPKIGEDLDASTSALQWILNGYLLTLASLILLGGSLGDRLGRRRVFQAGVALFTVASLGCAVAPTVELLIVARLVQGVGGALLTPGSLAIIEASFRPADRARAIGAWSGLGGVATAFGPLLGGWLIGAISWRAIFVINLPIGVFVAWAASRHVPESRDPTATGKLDTAGAGLAAIGLGGTTYALIEAPERGASAAIVATAVIGIAALIGFFMQERRSANPMLPLSIFRSRQFSAANAVTFVVYAALGVFFFLLVSFLQISMGYTPIEAGSASLPVTGLMLLGSARSGEMAQRIGPRIPLTLGPLIIAAGLLLMLRINPGDSYVSTVLPAVFVFGLGLTLVVAPVTATVLAAVDSSHAGIASGVNNAVARVAGLLAVAVIPVAAGLTGDKFYESSAMTHGFHVGMAISAGLALLGAVVAWTTISSGVLHAEAEPDGDTPDRLADDFSCGIGAPPLRPGREAESIPAPPG